MSRLKTTLLALVSLNAFGFWVVSCKDDNTGPACTPGTTRLCAGVSRCQGTQACLDDGSGYGDCDCSGAPRKAPPTMSSTPATMPYIGRSCTADADCGTGLTCFTAAGNNVFGGGAAGGYCTLNCNGNDSVCTAIDAQSACVGTGVGQPICLRTCLSQDPTSGAENKCLGRVDVVCKSPAALMQTQYTGLRMTSWCFPQCNSDDDCPGRHCNLGTGVCSDTAPTGTEIGGRCSTNADCIGGACVQVGVDDFLCSAPCVFGQPVGCGYGLSPAVREAACLAPLVQGFLSSEGQGDLGFCAETCDVDTDCAQHAARGWACAKTATANQQLFGRSGFCLPPQPDAGVTDAGDAGSLDAGSSDASASVDGG
jgi:hypothetical protein